MAEFEQPPTVELEDARDVIAQRTSRPWEYRQWPEGVHVGGDVGFAAEGLLCEEKFRQLRNGIVHEYGMDWPPATRKPGDLPYELKRHWEWIERELVEVQGHLEDDLESVAGWMVEVVAGEVRRRNAEDHERMLREVALRGWVSLLLHVTTTPCARLKSR